MDEYFVYIDEAGDEGFGKLRSSNSGGQSKWLLLGAAIISKENDRLLPKWRDEIMAMFPQKGRRDLHFKNLKHEQKVAACRHLSDKPVGACVVCSDKTTVPDLSPEALAVYKSKGHLYNYLVRRLLEHVSLACAVRSERAGRNCKIHVTFSKRGGTDYGVMRDYLFLMRDGREKLPPARSIRWDVLNPEDIKVEDHANRAGLQIADLITSATYAGLERNPYGDTEPRYAALLSRRYLRMPGIKGTGITIIPKASLAKAEVGSLFDVLG